MTTEELIAKLDPNAGWHLYYDKIRDENGHCPIQHVFGRSGWVREPELSEVMHASDGCCQSIPAVAALRARLLAHLGLEEPKP